MKITSILLFLAFMAYPAHADNCSRSLDRVLDGSRELKQKPQAFRALLAVCLETTQMSNVRDVVILESGAIGITPRDDSVMATATTLSQFCARFPKERVQFVSKKPRQTTRSERGATVTSCAKVLGH